MSENGDGRLPQQHVIELNSFFAAHFRRKEVFRRRQPDIEARYTGTTADTAAQALNVIALRRAREIIEDMPPRQKKVALMRWQDRMKAAEIAAELGIAEGSVHAHLHSARDKLVAGLARYYPFGTDNAESGTDNGEGAPT